MSTQHFTSSDRYMAVYDQPSQTYYGSEAKEVYDRITESFTQLPVVVIEATASSKVVTLFSGRGNYQVLACSLDYPERGNFFYDTVVENLDVTHKTQKVDGVLTKVRRKK